MASIFATNGGRHQAAPNKVNMVAQALYQRLGVSKDVLDSGFSLESFREGGQGFDNGLVAAKSTIQSAVSSAMGDSAWAGLSDGQRDAATILGMAAGPGMAGSYQRSFLSLESASMPQAGEGVSVFAMPAAGAGVDAFDYRYEGRDISTEVFDGRKLDNFLATSISFHILAARQSAAAEAMYPTYSMPPDTTGFTIEVDRPLVFNQIWHNASGDTVQFDKHRKLLLNARMDSTILANTATKITPWYESGNAKNNANFIDPAIIPTREVTIGTDTFDTNALAPGKEFSFLGIGSNPSIAHLGQQNTTDTLDLRATLENIYIQVTPATGTASVIKFNTLQMPTAQFNPSFEGQQRKMVLTFDTKDLVVSSATLDHNTGVAATAFAGIAALTGGANLRVRFAADITGKINLESSELKVNQCDLTIDSVVSVSGTGPMAQITPITDPTVLDAINALFTSIKLVGYDAEGFRSNMNRRQYGQLVTCERLKDAHIVPLGAPVTAQVPIVDAASHTVDITAPASMVMIRNTNQAFSQLFTFEQTLALAQSAFAGGDASAPAIRAIGRYILRRPWYGKDVLQADQEINTLKTAERNIDLQAAITNKLRMMINEGYYQTNMQAAMDNLGAKVGEKPKIKLVCNPIVANYLMVPGDTRTLGDGWEYEVISDPDNRLTIPNGDTLDYPIYAFFTVPGVDGPHVLNFGNMIYQPDLISNLPITRDNATTVEFTVQPRTLHVNHCPVLFRLDVKGLHAAATERLSLPMEIT